MERAQEHVLLQYQHGLTLSAPSQDPSFSGIADPWCPNEHRVYCAHVLDLQTVCETVRLGTVRVALYGAGGSTQISGQQDGAGTRTENWKTVLPDRPPQALP